MTVFVKVAMNASSEKEKKKGKQLNFQMHLWSKIVMRKWQKVCTGVCDTTCSGIQAVYYGMSGGSCLLLILQMAEEKHIDK